MMYIFVLDVYLNFVFIMLFFNLLIYFYYSVLILVYQFLIKKEIQELYIYIFVEKVDVNMVLNKYMYLRNLYKDKVLNFKIFVEKYLDFVKCVFKDLKGKCYLDYKSFIFLRQLVIVFFKEDFDLEVEMLFNRFILTILLRLNYILWIEDILKEFIDVKGKGIDIGLQNLLVIYRF